MPKSPFASLAVLAFFLLCSVVAANESTRQIRTAQDEDSRERRDAVVPWKPPKYWNAYLKVFTSNRLKRCAARNGEPPANGSSCNTLATGWYSCLFGEIQCQARTDRLPGRGGFVGKQFISVKNHPTKRCDCVSGKWTCNNWNICAKPQICGSRGLPPCPDGQTCIDPDPNDSCDQAADCPGICIPNIAVCPKERPIGANVACSKQLRCAYGKESCCEQEFDSLVCQCNVGESFRCLFTDACLRPSCDPKPCEVTKTTWPEVVGTSGQKAKKLIEEEQLCLQQVVIVPLDSILTTDFRTDRVRIFVNKLGIVTVAPMVG